MLTIETVEKIKKDLHPGYIKQVNCFRKLLQIDIIIKILCIIHEEEKKKIDSLIIRYR